jgi:HJR/Mrr/RecB family endonuclease
MLRFFIDDQERDFTYTSVSVPASLANNEFDKLTGPAFEELLRRLYAAMGYSVIRVGRTGDQGADLIAVKGNEKLAIQAKRYTDMSVGTAAVQQVASAKNIHDCNKAAVVTTSSFTREAQDAARANGVELIAREALQKMLLDALGENWR